jgi:hypothetical protein
MPGTLTVNGMSAGLVSGEKVLGPITMTGSNTVGQITDASLSSGDNTFSVPPSGAYAVAILLGQSTAVTVKVRTNLNSGDVGLEIAPASGTAYAVFPLPTGVTELILNASGSLPGIELWFI